MAVWVTVHDEASDERERALLPADSYIVLCGERMHVSSEQHYPKSRTVVLTIKPLPERDE